MSRYVWGGLFTVLLVASTGRADDVKDVKKEAVKFEDKLTKEDPLDSIFKKSFSKTHTVKLEAGQPVRIELKATGFTGVYHVQDGTGKRLLTYASQFTFTPKQTDTFRIVVTSAQADKTGDYILTVTDGDAPKVAGPAKGGPAKEPNPAKTPAGANDKNLSLKDRAPKLMTMAPEARAEYLAELKAYLKGRGDKIDMADVVVAQIALKSLERASHDQAAVTFAEYMDILANTQDKQAKKHVEGMEFPNRRFRLLGKELTLQGMTVDGKEFDIKDYRGKVVLIDFWATWCSSCVAEMPNVAKNYEKYKDKGFEVIGISIDADRETLTKFLETKKLPWLCLHEPEGKSGTKANYRQVGIIGVPTCILVDRDGKVLSIQARGPRLGELLEKHMANAK